MKRFIVSAVIAVVVSTVTAEEVQSSGWDASVNLKSVVASQYLGCGSGAVLYNRPVVQTDLFTSFKNGAYVDVWNSTPFKDFNKNLGTEQDLGIGWTGSMSKLGVGDWASNLVVDAGFTYCAEPSIESFGAGDMWWNHVKISHTFRWVTVNAMYENFLFMPGSHANGADLISLGASKRLSFCHDRLSASTSLSAVYDTGGTYRGEGFFLRGSAELDCKLTKRLTFIVAQLGWYAPLSTHDNRKLDKVLSSGLAWQF